MGNVINLPSSELETDNINSKNFISKTTIEVNTGNRRSFSLPVLFQQHKLLV